MLKNFLVLIFFIFISCSDNNEEELLKSINNCVSKNWEATHDKGRYNSFDESYEATFKNCELEQRTHPIYFKKKYK